MESKTYWAERAARDMKRRVDDAEKLNKTLLKAYKLASKELHESAALVFDKYQSRYGLTVAEAEALLKVVRDPEDVEAILRELRKNPKNRDLIMQLEAGAYGARIRHYKAMQANVDAVVIQLAAATEVGLEMLLQAVARDAYYRSIFNTQQEISFFTPFKSLTADRIDAVLHKGWSGADFSTRIWRNGEALAKALKEEIVTTLLTGRSLKKATDALSARLLSGYNDTRRLVRTETTYVSNELQAQSYEAMGVKQYIYVAILDYRTSKICRSLDKKVFPVNARQQGLNYPPMHPYCRSCTVPWTPPELLRELEQRALDPRTGRPNKMLVPMDMTYNEWYETYVAHDPNALADEKATQRRAADLKQYEAYKAVLGKKAPKTFTAFQRIKYKEPETWAELKKWRRKGGTNET